ncbi:hypothetical protein HJG60_011580 [Phyllostomus discolor]|uniref:Uncharacterized protein n=1 Tax=Phyllostomus discolor TaxID=89673 RepID=A0A833ZU06_9CHIR|nr:hypothetical protein HJG60_011580 [Phyllostomus discolor]
MFVPLSLGPGGGSGGREDRGLEGGFITQPGRRGSPGCGQSSRSPTSLVGKEWGSLRPPCRKACGGTPGPGHAPIQVSGWGGSGVTGGWCRSASFCFCSLPSCCPSVCGSGLYTFFPFCPALPPLSSECC